jgi:hypothetical protein
MELRPSGEAASRSATQFSKTLRNPKFHYLFTTSLHWSPSRARWIQSIPPHPISLRSISILSSHLCLGLPSGLFASGFLVPVSRPKGGKLLQLGRSSPPECPTDLFTCIFNEAINSLGSMATYGTVISELRIVIDMERSSRTTAASDWVGLSNTTRDSHQPG